MNFNTLSGSAKLHKKLEVCATGQATASGEVPNIAILCAAEKFANQKLVDCVVFGIKSKNALATIVQVPNYSYASKINPMTAKYAASFARTAASSAEAIIKCGLYDGVVIVADCDVTAAGLLEGAAKANCPALILPTGTCSSATKSTSNYRIQGLLTGGKINARENDTLIQNASMSRAISNSFNSVSTFFIMVEAMGFCVPTASHRLIDSAVQLRNAVTTGASIAESAKDVLTPKKFLTRSALGNAIAVCLAIGGDISAVNLLSNLVSKYEKIPHGIIAEYTAKTPLLVAPENQGCKYLSQNCSGIAGILKQLSSIAKLLDEQALVHTGEKLRNALTGWGWESAGLGEASKTSQARLVKGTACEDGGYAQPTENTPISISGKAWVYATLEDADKALTANNIPDNSIIVVHNCVDTYVSALAYTIEGMSKQDKIAIITDGLCDKTSALVVTRCSPDSLANGNLANIQNGDMLEIDLGRGRLNTNINSKDIKARAKKNATKKPVVYFS